jgi:hypothetical protein
MTKMYIRYTKKIYTLSTLLPHNFTFSPSARYSPHKLLDIASPTVYLPLTAGLHMLTNQWKLAVQLHCNRWRKDINQPVALSCELKPLAIVQLTTSSTLHFIFIHCWFNNWYFHLWWRLMLNPPIAMGGEVYLPQDWSFQWHFWTRRNKVKRFFS